MARKSKDDRIDDLIEIMRTVQALADVAWPRDDAGQSEMPETGQHAIMDIQMTACKALDLPEDLPLLTGNSVTDLDMLSDQT